PMQALTKRTL
ncbi:hypothetical protein VN97_g10832, partial [Penicillium thymicola]